MSGSRPSRIASPQRDARRRQSAANSCSLAIQAARRERLETGPEDGLAWFAVANVAHPSADRGVLLRFGAAISARDFAATGGPRRYAPLISSRAGVARAGKW